MGASDRRRDAGEIPAEMPDSPRALVRARLGCPSVPAARCRLGVAHK
jgi:hypothetical protein